MANPGSEYAAQIRAEAQRLGFWAVGFAKAERLDDEARRLEAWLRQGAQGRMAYMANHFDLRVDPTRLVPDAKTVICLASITTIRTNNAIPKPPKSANTPTDRIITT